MEVEFTKNKPQLILANRKKECRFPDTPVMQPYCTAKFVLQKTLIVGRMSIVRAKNPETTTKNLEKKHLL